MQKLNILSISGYPPWHPKVGGGDIIAYKLSETLAKMGHRITYLSVAEEPLRKKIAWGDFKYISEGEDFSSISFTKDFDILHIHSIIGLRFSIYKKLRKNNRCIMGMYAPLVHKLPRSIGEVFYRYLCKDADLVITLSEFSKQNTSSAYGIDPAKIEVMYAGVDDAFFETKKLLKDTMLYENDQSQLKKPIRLLFSGRLDQKQQKGVDILFKAMPLILEKHNVILDIIGDGVRLAHYKALIQQMGLEKFVRFRGFLPHDMMPEEYSAADLFVFPSRRESFGLVLAEAMASNLPVVSTTAGAIPEVVENGVTGILVPPEDSEQLAKAVIHLIDDPEKMKLMSIEGKKRVEKYFTWDKIANNVVNSIQRNNIVFEEKSNFSDM